MKETEILHWLWYGPFRRQFKYVIRHLYRNTNQVRFGLLRGSLIEGQRHDHMLGLYELSVQKIMLAHLHAGDVFYDVGANMGYLTLLASKLVGDSGLIYAFEPLPLNTEAMQRVLKNNHVNNCRLIPKAVTGHGEMVNLYYPLSNLLMASITSTHPNRVSVESVSLDTFANQHQTPNLIKVDVEGAEAEVLAGSVGLCRDVPDLKWIIEIHSPESEQRVKEMLADSGYSFNSFDERHQPYPCQLFAWKGQEL